MAQITSTLMLPFSEKDNLVFRKLIEKAWFMLFRTYGAFFLALGYLFYRMYPGSRWRGSRLTYGKLTALDYLHVYLAVAVFFGLLFSFLVLKDYRRILLPLYRDVRLGNKTVDSFTAQKYNDPVYGKCLLFYPGKEDFYIELSKDEFAQIINGEQLHLESSCLTGEVLALKNEKYVFLSANEFSFADMPAPRLFKYYD